MNAPVRNETQAFAAFQTAVADFQRNPTMEMRETVLTCQRAYLEAAGEAPEEIERLVSKQQRKTLAFIDKHGTRTNGRDRRAAG